MDGASPSVSVEATELPLLDQMFDAGLLVPTGVDGLYGRSAAYQQVAGGIGQMVDTWGTELGATKLQFPPLLARSTFAKTNYLESFPDLMGSVHVFRGGNVEHRELLRRVEDEGDWPSLLEPADVVLGSAACHAVYPLCVEEIPPEGQLFNVSSFCFRHEPSLEPTRLQAFVMHEVVLVGSPEQAQEHRDVGLARGMALLSGLGLEMTAEAASDPFFGRVGNVLAAGQIEEELKFEGVTQIRGNASPTAIMSANAHRDHFGRTFTINLSGGSPAHSSCVAFGIDRIVVALLAQHGFDVGSWPEAIRAQLGL